MSRQGCNEKRGRIGNALTKNLASLRADAIWLCPLLVIHLGLTLPLAWKLNLWIDEASSLATSGKTLLFAVRQAYSYELQAPLYFALLNLWRIPSEGIFHARLFSVACTVLMLVLVVGITRRYLPKLHPAWIVAAFAVHPFTIWAATEIRVYALVMLLSAVLIRLFFDGFLAAEPQHRARWGYCVVALLSLYTYYFLGFLLLAQGCALLVQRRWLALRVFVGGMLAVGVGIVPLLLLIPSQVTGYKDGEHRLQNLKMGLQMLSWRLQELLLPAKWPPLAPWGVWILIGFAVLTLLLLGRQLRHLAIPTHLTMWITAAVIAVCLLAAYTVTDTAFLESRHTTVLFLPVILSLFTFVATIPRQRAVAGWVLVSCFFYVTSLAVTYSSPAKTGDWARVAAYLMAAEKEDQPILVFQPLSAVPLANYYTGVNSLLPIPRPEAFRSFHDPDSLLKNENQIEAVLAQVPGEKDRIWLVTDELCWSINLDLNCKILEAFIAKHYEVETNQKFYRSQVRLLRRKSLSPSSLAVGLNGDTRFHNQ